MVVLLTWLINIGVMYGIVVSTQTATRQAHNQIMLSAPVSVWHTNRIQTAGRPRFDDGKLRYDFASLGQIRDRRYHIA